MCFPLSWTNRESTLMDCQDEIRVRILVAEQDIYHMMEIQCRCFEIRIWLRTGYLTHQDNISASGISCEWLYNPCTAETIGENGIHIRMWHSFGNDLQLQPCIAWVRRIPSVKVPGVGSDRWRLEHLQVLSTVCQMSPVTIWALSEVSLLVALRTKLAHIIPMLTVKSVFFVQVGPSNQTMLLVSQ
jgi:hypothetical protein